MEMRFVSLFQPFGTDIFCLGKKFLVFNMVSRNIKIKYRRSILGLFWTLLNPMALAAIYYFVFKVILKIQVPHYLVFILSGVLSWNFFAGTLVEGMESIVGNFGLVSKVPVPLQIFPYVGAITNLVTLFFALPILVGAAIISKATIGPSIVLLLFYWGALFFIGYGFSLLMAILFVYFRDLRHIMGIVVQLWFYGTPVIYNETMVPEKFRWILALNPLGYVFSGIHEVLVEGRWPPTGQLLIVCAWVTLMLALTLIIQKHFTTAVVERI